MSYRYSELIEMLSGLFSQGGLANSYLFYYQDNSRPESFLADLVDRFASQCEGQSRADLIELVPDLSQPITVADAKGLHQSLVYLPLEWPYKIVLIEQAERLMRPQPLAANVLLKALEEPPAKTVFLLTCSDRHQLLDTILSRCQELVLRKPSSSTTATASDTLLFCYLTYLAPSGLDITLYQNPGYEDPVSSYFRLLTNYDSLSRHRISSIADLIVCSMQPELCLELFQILIRDTITLRRGGQLIAPDGHKLQTTVTAACSTLALYNANDRLGQLILATRRKGLNIRALCEKYLADIIR